MANAALKIALIGFLLGRFARDASLFVLVDEELADADYLNDESDGNSTTVEELTWLSDNSTSSSVKEDENFDKLLQEYEKVYSQTEPTTELASESLVTIDAVENSTKNDDDVVEKVQTIISAFEKEGKSIDDIADLVGERISGVNSTLEDLVVKNDSEVTTAATDVISNFASIIFETLGQVESHGDVMEEEDVKPEPPSVESIEKIPDAEVREEFTKELEAESQAAFGSESEVNESISSPLEDTRGFVIEDSRNETIASIPIVYSPTYEDKLVDKSKFYAFEASEREKVSEKVETSTLLSEVTSEKTENSTIFMEVSSSPESSKLESDSLISEGPEMGTNSTVIESIADEIIEEVIQIEERKPLEPIWLTTPEPEIREAFDSQLLLPGMVVEETFDLPSLVESTQSFTEILIETTESLVDRERRSDEQILEEQMAQSVLFEVDEEVVTTESQIDSTTMESEASTTDPTSEFELTETREELKEKLAEELAKGDENNSEEEPKNSIETTTRTESSFSTSSTSESSSSSSSSEEEEKSKILVIPLASSTEKTVENLPENNSFNEILSSESLPIGDHEVIKKDHVDLTTFENEISVEKSPLDPSTSSPNKPLPLTQTAATQDLAPPTDSPRQPKTLSLDHPPLSDDHRPILEAHNQISVAKSTRDLNVVPLESAQEVTHRSLTNVRRLHAANVTTILFGVFAGTGLLTLSCIFIVRKFNHIHYGGLVPV